MELEKLLYTAIKASFDASEKILQVYNSDDFQVQIKQDNSPLTKADKDAHNAIIHHLKATNIPVLSEEDCDISYEERKEWSLFWLVDPLDGTKEFIKKNDEFTVNIALIQNGTPIAGVVYAPILKTLYFAAENLGAFRIENSKAESWKVLLSSSISLPLDLPSVYTVVGSRSHMNKETQSYLKQLEKQHSSIEIITKGSSLKICMVAEGTAHEYPRFGPTMEWDTAAGHAIAKYAKARVTQGDASTPLVYNKENLLNPWFIIKQ